MDLKLHDLNPVVPHGPKKVKTIVLADILNPTVDNQLRSFEMLEETD